MCLCSDMFVIHVSHPVSHGPSLDLFRYFLFICILCIFRVFREHLLFEETRSCHLSTGQQQYLLSNVFMFMFVCVCVCVCVCVLLGL